MLDGHQRADAQAAGKLRDGARALKAYERVAQMAPQDALIRVKLGETYRDLDRPADAARLLREAVRATDDFISLQALEGWFAVLDRFPADDGPAGQLRGREPAKARRGEVRGRHRGRKGRFRGGEQDREGEERRRDALGRADRDRGAGRRRGVLPVTPLHDLDVLRSLAEGAPGPSRDWANARLAIRAGELLHLPSDGPGRMVTLLAAPSKARRSGVTISTVRGIGRLTWTCRRRRGPVHRSRR